MRTRFLLAACLLIVAAFPAEGFAQKLSVENILKNLERFDRKTIVFEGEVIGDVMRRGEFAWVNVYFNGDALGVWMPASLAAEIDHAGSYRETGDKIEVVGIFNRACPEHGGDMDLHAQAMRRISCGAPFPRTMNVRKRNSIVFLLGVLTLLWILTRSRRN